MQRKLGPILLVLFAAGACARQPRLAMEEPGRPAVIWNSETKESEKRVPVREAETDLDADLAAEVADAERNGGESLALADALYRLAISRRRAEDLDEAERLYRRSLDIRERLAGPDDPDVAATLNNLAGLQASRGDYAGAEPLLKRALAIRSHAFGDEHPLTAQSMSNLALLYAAQSRAAEAEPLYRRALAILESSADRGEEGDIERVRDNYAALLRDTGRDDEAEALEKRAPEPGR